MIHKLLLLLFSRLPRTRISILVMTAWYSRYPPRLINSPNAIELSTIIDIYLRRLTMTPIERLFTTFDACKHVFLQGTPGAFAECGVWRGGHAILAKSLFHLWGDSRDVYLYDTYSGMTTPSHDDVEHLTNISALRLFRTNWLSCSLEEVQKGFLETQTPLDNVHFIEGDVCATLLVPSNLPTQISVLRLDTDWYASTRAGVRTLYPLVVTGGLLIVDDYGHWQGARKAIDEYFLNFPKPYFHYIDYTCIVGSKQFTQIVP